MITHSAGMPLALARVLDTLSGLPGIGPKTAMRLSLNLLRKPSLEVRQLAESLASLHDNVGFCEHCGCFAEKGGCLFCKQEKRDQSLICVVEQPVDVLMLERSGGFSGAYHVLQGRLSPVDGMGPEQINLKSLDHRLHVGGVRELILATSATVDGEATAHYLSKRYASLDLVFSRISRGIPEGGELEYVDEFTLSRAINQRISWE
ncbi:MAG: recombination mediator RecR [Mariprofundaceae bacterium]